MSTNSLANPSLNLYEQHNVQPRTPHCAAPVRVLLPIGEDTGRTVEQEAPLSNNSTEQLDQAPRSEREQLPPVHVERAQRRVSELDDQLGRLTREEHVYLTQRAHTVAHEYQDQMVVRVVQQMILEALPWHWLRESRRYASLRENDIAAACREHAEFLLRYPADIKLNLDEDIRAIQRAAATEPWNETDHVPVGGSQAIDLSTAWHTDPTEEVA